MRFLGQEPVQGSRRSPTEQIQVRPQASDEIVQVVVQIPNLVEGSGDGKSSSPPRTSDTVAEDDGVTPQTERPPKATANPDADFQSRYREIKSLAWTWVKNHFSDITPERKKALNLLHLAHASPQLMEYANWISCCGQKRTWEDVFNEQRALLVYGILGKMLEVHVFGHEMFGADKEQLRELRELDMELVNRDGTSVLLLAVHRWTFKLTYLPGFYRQTCRAHKILAFLPTPTTPPPYFHHSLTDLQASFMLLLSPLLPEAPPPELQPQLFAILLEAATLSLSARREGKVVYHWETHPAVGSLFESNSMHILNETEHREEDNWRRNTDVEVVTMAGWPSCVAYRPIADEGKKNNKGKKSKLGINRIGRAEVCVTFGPAIRPLSSEPEDWRGKSLRVEMTERDEVKKAKDRNAGVAKKVAGLGVAVSAMLGLEYVIANPKILEEAMGYLGSLV